MSEQSGLKRSLRRRFATALEDYRRGGAAGVVMKLLLLLGYHRIILYEIELSAQPPLAAQVPLDECRFIDRGAMDELVELRPDLRRNELEERFDLDERCFAAYVNGKIACTCWVHQHSVPFPELGYELGIGPNEVYVGDVFTAPHLRGKRISPAMTREMMNLLVAEGVERWIAYVRGGNYLGLINAERVGSRETGRVAALKLGPLPAIRMPYLPRPKRR